MAEAMRDQSEFNFAFSFLNRLNLQFYLAMDAAQNLNGFAWFHALLNIRRELSDDMKAGEMEIANKYMDDINNALSLLSKRKKPGDTIPTELYKKLDSFEIFLRGIVKAAGYKSKFKDDPSLAIFGST